MEMEHITVDDVIRATCLGRSGAWRRLRQYRAGAIGLKELFQATSRQNKKDALITQVQEATGVTRSAAVKRVARFRRGEWTREQLFAAKDQASDRGAQFLSAMADRPRTARLASIPGATQWEREHLGL